MFSTLVSAKPFSRNLVRAASMRRSRVSDLRCSCVRRLRFMMHFSSGWWAIERRRTMLAPHNMFFDGGDLCIVLNLVHRRVRLAIATPSFLILPCGGQSDSGHRELSRAYVPLQYGLRSAMVLI
ncbi:protein of unknown function [Burkholderia multivorans]